MRVPAAIFAAAILSSVATAALAAPITGEVSINGSNVYTNTTITFIGNSNVGGTSGSFNVLSSCTGCVSMTLNPLTATSTGELWSITEGSITSTLSITTDTFSTGGTVTLPTLTAGGSGVLTLTGFDATPGTWELTTQGPQAAVVTFSATGVGVPEPASLIILGSGLLALGAMRRRRRDKTV